MKSQAVVSFLAGAIATTLLIFLFFQPVLTKQRAAVRERTAALDESSTELRSTLDSLRECRAQLEQATVIMEFAPGRGTPVTWRMARPASG